MKLKLTGGILIPLLEMRSKLMLSPWASVSRLLSRAQEPGTGAVGASFRLSAQLPDQAVDKLTNEVSMKNQKGSCHEARWLGILLLDPDRQV